MITFMRRYRKTLQVGLLVVVASFVGSLFIFGSGRLGGPDRRETVASVNGEDIPIERYQRRYQAYLDAYSQVYKDRFTPEIAERLGMPQQVVADLVQEAVVVQRARAEGLQVTDEELNALVHSIPAFQENGHFSMQRYQEFLRRRGIAAPAFEQDVRRELTRMKMESTVKSGVKVSDAEVEQAYAARHEEVRAAWALVELGPLLESTPAADAEVDAYYKNHAAEFREPERRRVQYVAVNPKDFTRPVSDADVKKYYDDHAAEFETPRQVRVSHILVRVPETGGSAAEDQAKAKAADILRRAKAGEDFAKLARELSEDRGSAVNGGDLGFIRKGEMVPQFEQVAFALKKGELSAQPVRTPFGYHVIRVTDVREGGQKPLAAIAPQIRDRLAAEAAERAAQARAEEVRGQLQAAPDFMAAAKKLGLAPVETTMARTDLPPGARPDPLEEAAFGLAAGGVSAPVQTPMGFVVLKTVQQIPAAIPPLGQVRDKVVAAVKRQKADATALERARQIAAAAKTGDLAAAAKKVGAQAGDTGRFSRVKPAERLPGDALLAALHAPVGGVTDPIKAQQGYYVLKVLERVPADTSGLSAERDKLTRELLTQKQAQAWESWLAGARGTAKVEMFWRPPTRRG